MTNKKLFLSALILLASNSTNCFEEPEEVFFQERREQAILKQAQAEMQARKERDEAIRRKRIEKTIAEQIAREKANERDKQEADRIAAEAKIQAAEKAAYAVELARKKEQETKKKSTWKSIFKICSCR